MPFNYNSIYNNTNNNIRWKLSENKIKRNKNPKKAFSVEI